jgi:uncharacterized protein
MTQRLSHVVGFDDAPFHPADPGDVTVIGAVYAGHRLEGVLSGVVQRDGDDATSTLIDMVVESRFALHLQAVFLQGIALAGFNVVDCHGLHEALQLPVIVVARKQPDLAAIKHALLDHVANGVRKWQLIEQAGPMVSAGQIFVQHFGISYADTCNMIKCFAVNSLLPEPLRTAHLIAGGITGGHSRQRV